MKPLMYGLISRSRSTSKLFILCHWILLFLRKDYYLTDVIFMGKTLTDFVEDLKTLSLPELFPIIKLLEQAEIEKIRISGD